MGDKLLDRIKVFEVYYSLGVDRSIPKLLVTLAGQYKSGIPSEGTLKSGLRDTSGETRLLSEITPPPKESLKG